MRGRGAVGLRLVEARVVQAVIGAALERRRAPVAKGDVGVVVWPAEQRAV